MNPELTPEIYTRQVEMLLERLHQDIDETLGSLPEVNNLKQLDAYVHQLNSYYYGSFHEKLFPLYRQLIQEDIQTRLNLALQEDTLRQGILGNIKRYAQLYNQVKRLAATLSQGKETTYQRILANDRYEDRCSIDLATALRLWGEHVRAAALQVRTIEEVLDDREFYQALNKALGNWPVIHFLEGLDLGQPEQGACYTVFLSYLRYCSSLLRQMQKDDKPFSRSSALMKELKEKTAGLVRRSIPPAFSHYRLYLSDQMGSILQVLPLYIRLGESDLYKNALRRLLQQLDDNILLLEKAQHLLIGGCRDALLQACLGLLEKYPDLIKQLGQSLNRLLDSLQSLEEGFSIPGESDFQNFSQQAQALLAEADLTGELGPGAKTVEVFALFTSLYHLDLERQYLLRSIEIMREDNKRRHELQELLLQVVNNLDSLINLLGNIRADLERLLAPRNLSRLWKDLDVRVERIPLECGKPFPNRFLHLLDDYKLSQLPDSGENIIVYEEGDLFIIRVGDQQDDEVPNISLARKE